MIRYRVVQHFNRDFKPIYAALELEEIGGYAPSEKITQETSAVQKGNWIETDILNLPGQLVPIWSGHWARAKDVART